MTNELMERIQQLLDERAKHAEALVRIEETLSGIGALLGTSFKAVGSRRGRPPGPAGRTTSLKVMRKRGRGNYAETADELVLDFVGKSQSPTTREINAYWKSKGRGHTADNTLVKLVKAKQLKRIHLDGQRGSKYTLA